MGLCAVISQSVGSGEESDREAHHANLKERHEEGSLAVAGPFEDPEWRLFVCFASPSALMRGHEEITAVQLGGRRMGLFVVMSQNVGSGGSEETREAHYAYLKAHQEEGSLVAAGPFADRSGALFVYFATTLAAAEALASADPYHASGARTFKVMQWEPVRLFAWLLKPGGFDALLKPVGSPNRPG